MDILVVFILLTIITIPLVLFYEANYPSELEQETKVNNKEQILNLQREYVSRIQKAQLEAQKERELVIKNREIENKNREIENKNREIILHKRQAEFNKELYLQTLKRYEQNQNKEIPQLNMTFNSIVPLLLLALIVWMKTNNIKIKKAKIKLNKKHKMDNFNSILDNIYSDIDIDDFFLK